MLNELATTVDEWKSKFSMEAQASICYSNGFNNEENLKLNMLKTGRKKNHNNRYKSSNNNSINSEEKEGYINF